MLNLIPFEPLSYYDYQPMKAILSSNEHSLFMPKEKISNQDLIDHITAAQKNNKIAVFYQLTLADVNISHQKILVPIIFIACEFNGYTKLTDNIYYYPIYFYAVKFLSLTKFKLSLFYNNVAFVNCVFQEEASFERVKFLANSTKYQLNDFKKLETNFPNAFNKRNSVDFLGVSFLKDVTFINANMGACVLFANYRHHVTAFHGACDFTCGIAETEILEDSLDNKTTLKLDTMDYAIFFGVKFYSDLSFENRKFEKKTIFKEVIFYQAPKFHNCELHQDTDFQGSEFRDTITDGAERAYRTLKLMMDKKSARREEAMFFALEQKSLLNAPLKKYENKTLDYLRFGINAQIMKIASNQGVITNKNFYNNAMLESNAELHAGFYLSLTEKIISFIYLLFSNYGQSMKKPLVILITSLLGFFPLCYALTMSLDAQHNINWGEAYHASFQQLFRPFEIYSARYVNNVNLSLPFVFYFTATIQSMLNVGLLTLFILAVRGRFRMY